MFIELSDGGRESLQPTINIAVAINTGIVNLNIVIFPQNCKLIDIIMLYSYER
tara:strand:+ start:1789 stop:1947 length:159 start_codon:yes stop_codon:yes gene_type:complete